MNGDFGGCRGDGGTDCHSQCAHWLRNDRESFTGGAVGRAVGEIGEALPVAEEASRFRGSAPIGGHDSGRESVGTTVGNRPPLRGVQGVQWAGDRKGRPYERVARGAVQNRRAG